MIASLYKRQENDIKYIEIERYRKIWNGYEDESFTYSQMFEVHLLVNYHHRCLKKLHGKKEDLYM